MITAVILVLFIVSLLSNPKKGSTFSEYYLVPDSYQNYVLPGENFSFDYVINNHEGIEKGFSVQAFLNSQSFYEKTVSINDKDGFTDSPHLKLGEFADGSKVELRINDESLWIHLFNKKNSLENVMVIPKTTFSTFEGDRLVMPQVNFDIVIADNIRKKVTYKISVQGFELLSKEMEAPKEFTASLEETGFLIPFQDLSDITVRLYSEDELLDEAKPFDRNPELFVLRATASSEPLDASLFSDGFTNQSLFKTSINIVLTNYNPSTLTFNLSIKNTENYSQINPYQSKELVFSDILSVNNFSNMRIPLKIIVYENESKIKDLTYNLNFSNGRILLYE